MTRNSLLSLLLTPLLLALPALGAAGGADTLAVASPGPVTPEQVRSLALLNNVRMRDASRAVQSARLQRQEAFTKYFPEISASGMAFKSNKDIVQVGLLDVITIGFLTSGYAGGVTFVQPVFMGGQILNGNKLAEVGEAVAELQRRQSAQDVALTADKYYWQIAALEAKERTLRQAMTTVDTLRRDVQAALAAGLITRNELLEVDLRRSELQADSVDLANGIALCRMVLAQYTGQGPQWSPVLAYGTPVAVDTLPDALYRDPAQALAQTPAHGLLEAGVKAASLREKIEIGRRLPTVAAGGGYFYESIFNAKHGFGALMVTVEVPLTAWWGGSKAIRRARLEKATAQDRLVNDSELLCVAMRQAWDDLTAARRKTSIAADAITTAAENMRIYRAMYDAGTTTISDLLQAQALHRQACDRLTEAYAQYQVALTAYRVATAQI